MSSPEEPRFSKEFVTKNTRRLALANKAWRTPAEDAELEALIAWVTAETDRVRPLKVRNIEDLKPRCP